MHSYASVVNCTGKKTSKFHPNVPQILGMDRIMGPSARFLETASQFCLAPITMVLWPLSCCQWGSNSIDIYFAASTHSGEGFHLVANTQVIGLPTSEVNIHMRELHRPYTIARHTSFEYSLCRFVPLMSSSSNETIVDAFVFVAKNKQSQNIREYIRRLRRGKICATHGRPLLNPEHIPSSLQKHYLHPSSFSFQTHGTRGLHDLCFRENAFF